jgi:hypothetical protein
MELDNRYVKVQDHNDLVKDSVGNAVLNSDTDAFELFKFKRDKERKTEERLSNIEDKMADIFTALSQLLIEKK